MDLDAINAWIKSSLLNGERLTISDAYSVRHIWMEDGEIKSIHYPDLGEENIE